MVIKCQFCLEATTRKFPTREELLTFDCPSCGKQGEVIIPHTPDEVLCQECNDDPVVISKPIFDDMTVRFTVRCRVCEREYQQVFHWHNNVYNF